MNQTLEEGSLPMSSISAWWLANNENQ